MPRQKELKNKKRWTVSEAIAVAKELDIILTRPTVIRMCRESGLGYQATGPGGNWLIMPEKFLKAIREGNRGGK